MGSIADLPPKPWVQTPCIRSAPLSREAGCNIYLKLESLQPSSSFKSRGIGNLLLKSIASRGAHKPVHFYCSSGGNAGLACVTAATTLNCSATIVVPVLTSKRMVSMLKTLGAHVVQTGSHWSEADAYLREELLAKDENGVYVPPFDHPDLWEGHGSMIDELESQMADEGDYDGVVCSVGGGGLFAGIMGALERHGRLRGGPRRDVRVLAMETKGAESLALSLENKELSRLPAINSIATSLGATQVARKAYDWALRPDVVSCVLSDAEAAMGSVAFADDHRIVVEAACGVSVAAAYDGSIRTSLFPDLIDAEFEKLNVVIVVCGGSNVTLEMLERYKNQYSNDEDVLRKFHARRRAAEGVVETVEKVPYIMHDKEHHKAETVCGEKTSWTPAVGTELEK